MKLTKIETPPRTRIDTTVGTRVFAGDTMIYGDTGWRNVDWLPNGHDIETLKARRQNNTITLTGVITPKSGGEVSRPSAIPDGFRQTASNGLGVYLYTLSGAQVAYFYLNVAGTTYLRNTTNDSAGRFALTWVTDEAWPTSLPGTPA